MTVPDNEYQKERKAAPLWYTKAENFVIRHFWTSVIILVFFWMIYSAFTPESDKPFYLELD